MELVQNQIGNTIDKFMLAGASKVTGPVCIHIKHRHSVINTLFITRTINDEGRSQMNV